MSSIRKQVVVLYAETKLQKTIDLPGNSTVVKAKEEGMVAIKDHLNKLPGVPPVSLDPDCTDFYPAPKDNTTIIGSLTSNLMMVVYPEPPKGQRLTPSPFVNALQSAIHKVNDLKAQKSNVKPEENFGRDIAQLKQDNAQLRQENAELRQENAELRQETAELRRETAELKHNIKELCDQLDETTRAVLGDKVAVDKIRWRVLLDMGRDQLAVICRHKDWKEWKESKATSTAGDDFAIRTAMMTEAEMMLQDSTDSSEYWKAVGQDPSTLGLLIHPNNIRNQADIAEHSSTEKAIAESVLALATLGDRTHMIAIFCAIYDSEP
ncbi:uncharacterized protein EDB91DRAFT_1246209 [Suillus paluster]|uniref:uncharacterized protein n=1 Tax=Suillus paluster TaxID=48578 RepID=UPI001B87FA5E|nr:uncharacterized protein EDB91DRAFT_1246209 [Suillus paluster]KAG1745349.1 hypothetical protein EDB91DRAFT_1246209 [Suillus paluster]